MPHFDYNDPLNLLTPDIVKKIATLREYKGKQVLYLEARPDVLEKLCTSAKIRSADASNRIEGISTTDKRLNELMAKKSEPTSRAEREIAGYRDVLALIHESYEHMQLTPNVILQMHAMLHRCIRSNGRAVRKLCYGYRKRDRRFFGSHRMIRITTPSPQVREVGMKERRIMLRSLTTFWE
ncbi:hypothetical protein [Adlercreutzia agrestimuris]|uniref:hypothetical protein n=1 Tax=Adlercreutzia agrestimuris TaxID=2941324 RepID=UPI00203D7A72|nr:hypothetical protein [Adlercreutzia agrestimuris]